MYMYNDYIQHHGIVGQKWGVRRFQNADGTYTEAGLKRRYSSRDQRKLANDLKGVGEDSFNKMIKRVLPNPKVQEAIKEYERRVEELSSPSPKSFREKYENQSTEVHKKYMKKYVDKMVKDGVAEGLLDREKDKDLIKDMYNLETDWSLEDEEANENAMKDWLRDNNMLKDYNKSLTNSLDRMDLAKELADDLLGEYGSQDIGKSPYPWVTNTTSVSSRLSWIIYDYGDQSIKHSDYLEHHGILGQKWGVRRFQNADGSYTSAGLKRYGRNPKEKRVVAKNWEEAARIQQAKDQARPDYYDRKNESDYKDLTKDLTTTAILSGGSPVSMAISLIEKGVGAAVASAKTKKVEAANSSGNVDKKTGFHLKEDREYTRKEDMAAVNPSFKNLNDNTKNNCMLCTMTYDLRKRGYAVSANTTTSGYYTNDLSRWYPKAKIESVNNTNEKGKKSRGALVQNAISDMEKLGPGARGNVLVKFSQSLIFDVPAGGHSMAFEVNDDGKLEILDCQTNKVYKKPDRILSHCYDIQYARLDNVDLDLTHISEVAH